MVKNLKWGVRILVTVAIYEQGFEVVSERPNFSVVLSEIPTKSILIYLAFLFNQKKILLNFKNFQNDLN